MQKKESWSSRIGLIFAMAGFAVGFGNFLRFPVQAIQNGGGTFIIPYLISFLLIGIPMLLVEWSIGRYGGTFGFHSTPFMFQKMHRNPIWKYIGVFGIFTNIAVASYYTYMESWTLMYVIHSIKGTFLGLDQYQVIQFFDNYVSLDSASLFPFEAIILFIIVLSINTYFLSKGLQGGIEKVAKYGVPLLIFLGIFLAIRAVTMKAGDSGAIHDGTVGLNFLWTPDYESIWNPKVWLAAAGQIFFTIGIGWGTVQCYASYLSQKDDIALSSMSAGWTNEFVEIVLGAAIIIPLSVGFLGIDKVKELAELGGLALGFKTMPYLFSQWGGVFSAIAGTMWFGLLFLAGITSSLAMGSPFMSFMQNEYKWKKNETAIMFGVIMLLLGLPAVIFFNEGVLDEYDYWAGTFSLFIFSTAEIILFSWIVGIDKGWKEINKGADIQLPIIYKYILKFITPVLLIIIFLSSLLKPVLNDWTGAFHNLLQGNGWILDNSSIIKQMYNAGLREQIAAATDPLIISELQTKLYLSGGAKLLLLSVFAIFAILVFRASKKHNFN